MKINTLRLMAGLVMASLFTACSRPVAYFQPTQREQFATVTPASTAATEATTPAEAVAAATPAVSTPAPVAQATQVNEALNQLDALVRNDSKLAADKSVQKRMNRIRSLVAVAATTVKSTLAPSATASPKKANLMERMMLKKINKKINSQLAPANPNKTMANSGILATGAVLVILGLLLLLLTSGTGATIGVIVLLAGAVILLVGLL